MLLGTTTTSPSDDDDDDDATDDDDKLIEVRCFQVLFGNERSCLEGGQTLRSK